MGVEVNKSSSLSIFTIKISHLSSAAATAADEWRLGKGKKRDEEKKMLQSRRIEFSHIFRSFVSRFKSYNKLENCWFGRSTRSLFVVIHAVPRFDVGGESEERRDRFFN